jgi:SAM-dependent methyltransferase
MLGLLDNGLQRMFGLPYLFASRDFNIHCRCRYLLRKLTALQGRDLSLLDVGCGAGITLRHLDAFASEKIARYVGIDLQAERLKQRYRDVTDIDVAFHNVDLDDDWDVGRFDVVWCSEVIEHLMDDLGQVKKMMRAVKPGGLVLITTPCLDFVEHMGKSFPPILETSPTQDGGHVRRGYGAGDIRRLAAEAGLDVVSIDGVNPLTLDETKRRYTSKGVSWVINNIRMCMRGRRRLDFVVGEAFVATPERYASVGAAFVRPSDARPPRLGAEALGVPASNVEVGQATSKDAPIPAF